VYFSGHREGWHECRSDYAPQLSTASVTLQDVNAVPSAVHARCSPPGGRSTPSDGAPTATRRAERTKAQGVDSFNSADWRVERVRNAHRSATERDRPISAYRARRDPSATADCDGMISRHTQGYGSRRVRSDADCDRAQPTEYNVTEIGAATPVPGCASTICAITRLLSLLSPRRATRRSWLLRVTSHKRCSLTTPTSGSTPSATPSTPSAKGA
jgi:hypothetical protein